MKQNRHHHIALLPAILVLLAMTATGCSYKVVKHGNINQSLLKEIKSSVETSRGLKFKHEVEIHVSNRKEVIEFLEKNLEREMPPDEMEKQNELLVFVGLLDPGTDLKEELVKFVSDAGAGFYDQYEKRLILVKEVAKKSGLLAFVAQRDFMNELVIAHELTHAINDQNYDLKKTMEIHKENDDASQAIHWVEEGTATIVGFSHLLQRPATDEKVLSMVRQFNILNTAGFKSLYPDTPEVLKDILLSPYEMGSNFATYHLRSGRGWEGVNAMYPSKIISTEMILHPERAGFPGYLPVTVKMPEITTNEAGDLEMMEENVTGEYMTVLILKKYIPFNDAIKAANGWGGDKYTIYNTSTKPRKFLMFWFSKWDSESDAEEFASAAVGMIKSKYPGGKERFPAINDKGILFETVLDGEQVALVARAGDTVLYVEGKATGLDALEAWWVKSANTLLDKPLMVKHHAKGIQ